MKTNTELFAVRKLTLAVQGALMVMLTMPMVAYAEDDDVAALTHPANSVEIGVGDTTKDSAKFGEYNGLDKKGANLIGNIKVRGGDAYNSHDGGDGITRWEIKGTDLGTTSRELGGNVSKQGKWSLGIGYDELRHNITDSYQTPLQGSMGGNSFTLPTTFGIVDSKNKPTAVGGVIPPYGAQALTANQMLSFHTEDVHSDRKNASFNAGYNIDREWGVKFEFNHLVQSGAKLISAPTDNNVSPAGYTQANIGAEKILMLMNPTNYKTDTANLALNWVGDKGHFTGSYFLSLFRDANNGLSFSNPYYFTGTSNTTGATPPGAFPLNMLSTAPDNDFHQLNLNGGYEIAPATKLVGEIGRAHV
jgi:MtrB/PioB family decaheme-associated outer membrane protein